MIKKKILKLRKLLIKNNIDGYIVPKNDEYFCEFSLPDRLKSISNFSGSAGFAIILKKKIFSSLMEDTQYKQNQSLVKNLKFSRFQNFPQNIFQNFIIKSLNWVSIHNYLLVFQ